MTEVRDIRMLSQRAELEFHVRPNSSRRWAWWSGVWLALGCLSLFALAHFTGHHEIYYAGALSESHAFIAKDCRQCHNTWQPLRRLTSFDTDAYSTQHSSIDNQACLKCHEASEHHSNQLPAHRDLSCAACHREHQGQKSLGKVSDEQCIHCHKNLQTTEDSPTKFAQHVTGFDEAHGHPEFQLWRRLSISATDSKGAVNANGTSEVGTSELQTSVDMTSVRDVLKRFTPRVAAGANSPGGLRDRTELKFNHATHFQADRIVDRNGQREDLGKNCQSCHATDAAGRYMLPVHFESHCARCHPLWYDNENHSNDEVPHERLDLVRGYLTEKYTLAALKSDNLLPDAASQQPRPSFGTRSPLTAPMAATVEQRVAQGREICLGEYASSIARGV